MISNRRARTQDEFLPGMTLHGADAGRALSLAHRLTDASGFVCSARLLPVYLIHWRAPDWLRSSLGTIGGEDVVVTVIDNGGAPRVSCNVITTGDNLGFAGAANVALGLFLATEAPLCIIGAHDLHVAPDTFPKLLAAAEVQPEFGILGPDLRETGDPIATVGNVVERDWVSGTCMLLRRRVIEEIGFFDEAFGSYVEDVDLCMRARQAGWRVGTVSGAEAHGLGSGDSSLARTLTYANHMLLSAKSGDWLQVARWIIGLGRASLRDNERLVHFTALRVGLMKVMLYSIRFHLPHR